MTAKRKADAIVNFAVFIGYIYLLGLSELLKLEKIQSLIVVVLPKFYTFGNVYSHSLCQTVPWRTTMKWSKSLLFRSNRKIYYL